MKKIRMEIINQADAGHEERGNVRAHKGKRCFVQALLSVVLVCSLMVSPTGEWLFSLTGEKPVLTVRADEGNSGEEETGDLAVINETAKETVHITSLETYLDFARACRYDAYSADKVVELDTDLDLTGVGMEEAVIAYFAGTFRGNRHTISGLDMSESAGNVGLFRTVAKGAVISSLQVEASITPAGKQERVGGIVGENHGLLVACSFKGVISAEKSVGGIAGYNAADGAIRFCEVYGSILGTTYTGGICGYNDGIITACKNYACINTSYTDTPFSTDEISQALQSLMMGGRINAPETVGYRMDAGGITGFNTGYLGLCTNEAAVGYEHVGYNVGGIAGRSGGFINNCANSGEIKGRKDVGGITGQLQPYMQADFSDSVIVQLQNQLEALNAEVQTAIGTAKGAVGASLTQLQEIADKTQSAIDASQVLQSVSTSVPSSGDEAAEDVEKVIDAAQNAANDPDAAMQQIKDKIDNSQQIADEKDKAEAQTETAEDKLQELMESQSARSEAVNRLYTSLSDLTTQVNALNTQVQGGTNDVFDSFYSINAGFANITNTLSLAAGRAADTADNPASRFVDESVARLETATIGRITCSVNTGEVEADLNVGGIIGQAGVESDLDPERDIFQIGDSSLDGAFSVTCVIDRCASDARITSIGNYSGGIAGNMQMGVCALCSVSGVLDAGGGFAGGIVGYSKSTIMNCASACEISGSEYVGGIAGYGKEIANCATMATITAGTQYTGQIAGRVESPDVAQLHDNFFCAYDVYGIDGVSYAGMAERASYEELLTGMQSTLQAAEEAADTDAKIDTEADMTAEKEAVGDIVSYDAEYGVLCGKLFDTLTLTFVADGETVGTLTYSYKEETDKQAIPQVPAKEGFTGSFLANLPDKVLENRTVEAVYERRRTLIGSDYRRDGVQDAVLCEGSFETGSTLEVTSLQTQEGEIERLRIVIPNDGQAVHKIRYLLPDTNELKKAGYTIHLLGADGKTAVEQATTDFGAYVTFETDKQNMILVLTKKEAPAEGYTWLLIAAGCIVVAVAILQVFRRSKRKK